MMKHCEQTHFILHTEFLAEGWMREPSCTPSLPVDVERADDSHSLVGCLEGEGAILPKACKLKLLLQPLFLARCQSIKRQTRDYSCACIISTHKIWPWNCRPMPKSVAFL